MRWAFMGDACKEAANRNASAKGMLANWGPTAEIWESESNPLPGQPAEAIRAVRTGGVITGIEIDPGYAPYDSWDDELGGVGTLALSLFERDFRAMLKWMAAYIKANPTVSGADALAAIGAALPDNLCHAQNINARLMQRAVTLGYIASATWTTYRDWVVGASKPELLSLLG